MTPKLPLTVDRELWDAMAKATSREFADSYLSGAEQTLAKLLPRTVTAWERLKQDRHAMLVLKRAGLTLVKPPPFRGDDFDYSQAA